MVLRGTPVLNAIAEITALRFSEGRLGPMILNDPETEYGNDAVDGGGGGGGLDGGGGGGGDEIFTKTHGKNEE